MSYDYGFVIFTKMLDYYYFYIENNVMPLIQRKTILKDSENHKSRYTMKDGFVYSLLFT